MGTKKTDTKKKFYNPIPKKLKTELRARYEVGENLLDLAIEYKLNFYTLKNCASKEDWEKGKIAEIVYQEVEEFITENLKEEKLRHHKEYNYLQRKLTNDMLKDATTNNHTKTAEKLYGMRATNIQKGFDLGNQILGIETPREKLDHEIWKIKKKILEKELDKLEQGAGNLELD